MHRVYTWRAVSTGIDEKTWTLDPIHGGYILDAGVHIFDLMRWYAGAEAVRVFGSVRRFSHTATVKPTAHVQVQFASGVLGSFRLRAELPPPGFREPMHRMQIMGSKGLLEIDPYGKVDAALDGVWQTIWEQPPIDYLGDYLNPTRLEAFAAELQDFLDGLRDGRLPFATGHDGRAAVEIVEAANRSSETGQAIELPLGGTG